MTFARPSLTTEQAHSMRKVKVAAESLTTLAVVQTKRQPTTIRQRIMTTEAVSTLCPVVRMKPLVTTMPMPTKTTVLAHSWTSAVFAAVTALLKALAIAKETTPIPVTIVMAYA